MKVNDLAYYSDELCKCLEEFVLSLHTALSKYYCIADLVYDPYETCISIGALELLITGTVYESICVSWVFSGLDQYTLIEEEFGLHEVGGAVTKVLLITNMFLRRCRTTTEFILGLK